MDSKLEELRLDIAELKALEAQATRQKVKDVISLETRKLETQYVLKTEQLAASKSISNEPVKSSVQSVQTSNSGGYEIKLTNYAWDQSDKFVKLFVTLADVQSIPETNVSSEITSSSFTLRVKELGNKNYCFKVANLLEEIDPAKSYFKIKKDLVSVYLAKKKVGDHWQYLTSSDKAAKEARLPKIDKDEDPSKGMLNLLHQMYEDGDDNMKRTIASAWMDSKNKAPMM